MQIGRIESESKLVDGSQVVTHGKSQGYFGLPVLHKMVWDTVMEANAPSQTTAWFPTPKELDALNNGAAVHVELLNLSGVPPMRVEVGKTPESPEAMTMHPMLAQLMLDAGSGGIQIRDLLQHATHYTNIEGGARHTFDSEIHQGILTGRLQPDFHSLFFPHGLEWDCINGFRNIWIRGTPEVEFRKGEGSGAGRG